MNKRKAIFRALLSVCTTFLISSSFNDANAQITLPTADFWPQNSNQQISTYTDGHVVIGNANPNSTPAYGLPSLYIKTWMVGESPLHNNTSISVGNYRDPQTITDLNIVEIYSVDASGATSPIPNFIIDGEGKVGINTKPDVLMPFKLNVEGQSYFSDKVLIGDINNNISAGVSNDFKLYVDGGILTTKVKVEVTPWPDYVFAEGYELSDLDVVATYIEENKHLPGVPSAEEVQNDGVELGEMSAVLLQKVEELTLYMIALKKENEKLKQEIEKLKK